MKTSPLLRGVALSAVLFLPALNLPAQNGSVDMSVQAEANTHNVRDFVEAGAFGVEVITPAQLLLKLDQTS